MSLKNETMEPRLLTVEQASAYLNIHPQTVYVKAKLGELPFLRIGRAIRFDKLELDNWIKKKIKENEEKLLQYMPEGC